MKATPLSNTRLHALIAATLLALGGCAGTRQASSVERSGFLGPDVELREGQDGAPLLVFESPIESLAGYTKLIIDPVEVWYGNAAREAGTAEKDLVQLAESMRTALVEALSQDYELTSAPGPGTLRLRAALTEAVDEKPLANTLTTFVPPLRRAMLITGRLGGLELWTGRASAEGEVLDSVTGERLMAAIDRRIGTRSLTGSWTRWSDVRSAFEYWGERVRDRMAVLRSR